jgi:capsular polysaccharide biosynthesis protein
MDLKDYIRIVRRRGWIVVLLALLTASAAYGFSRVQPTVYQASVKLTARPARPDWGLQQTVSALLRSLAGDITTHEFMGKVIDRAKLDMTTDDLLDGRTVFVKDEAADFTIMVTVRDPSERVAIEIVNTIARLFEEQRDEWNDLQDKRDRIDVEIRDEARFASIYSPRAGINVAAGGILGALIGVVMVAAMEWLEAGVMRSTEDVERLGITALGAIPAESRWRH